MEQQSAFQQPQLQPQQNWNMPQEKLPNAGGILTCGILSLIFIGLIGVILAIIALSMASNARSLYAMYPGKYSEASLSRVNSGRVCAIIGLCLFGLALLIILIAVAANL